MKKALKIIIGIWMAPVLTIGAISVGILGAIFHFFSTGIELVRAFYEDLNDR